MPHANAGLDEMRRTARIARALPGQKMTTHELARAYGLEPDTVWVRVDGRKLYLHSAEFTLDLVEEKVRK